MHFEAIKYLLLYKIKKLGVCYKIYNLRTSDPILTMKLHSQNRS